MKKFLAATLCAFTVAGANLLRAEDRSNDTLERYANAQRIVADAWAAVDPAGRLRSAANLRLVLRGKSYARNQGLRPDGPPTETPIAWTELLDLTGNRWSWQQVKEIGGGYRFDARVVSTPEKTFVANMLTKEFSAFTPPENPDFPYRPLPAIILRRALQQRRSLRWRGRQPWDGRDHDVVDFAWNASATFALYIDPATRLLSKFDLVQGDAAEGDDVLEGIFGDYRDAGGVRFPTKYVQREGGKTTLELAYAEVAVDSPPAQREAFAVPAGFSEVSRSPHVTALAPGVFLLEDLGALYYYNVLFVEIDKGVAVFDAPLGDGVSRDVIKRIHQTLPNAPIRYLILSHYHDDHTAGIRPYVAEGATIVTTRGNQQFVERIAAVRPTVAAEPASAAPVRPKFLFVDGEHTLRDSNHVVQIRKVGPMGHVAEMLFLYLPLEKIVHQADLFSDFVPVNESMAWFYRQLESLRLPAGRITGVHMRTLEFRQYAAAMESYKRGGGRQTSKKTGATP
ncbi:MAG: MBL fold metallo-hydrolase [Acidobacteriota bacterium]|nr:MBL fold metallo-hydrolase [Acidobacteriota bacterium]